RRGIGFERLIELALPGHLAGTGDALLDAPELQDLDAAADVAERGIGGERRFESRERLVLAVQRDQRLRPPEQRRHVLPLRLERAIEVRQRGFRIFLRQLQVSERRFGGKKRRRGGERV